MNVWDTFCIGKTMTSVLYLTYANPEWVKKGFWQNGLFSMMRHSKGRIQNTLSGSRGCEAIDSPPPSPLVG